MLYGDNCLVLFYESFASGYNYARLGSVDDPVGLAETLGAGGVEVAFSSRDPTSAMRYRQKPFALPCLWTRCGTRWTASASTISIRSLLPQNGVSCLTRAAAKPNISTGRTMGKPIPFG